jgi:DNA invertase Pin-like site-specific DNA recombinase
MKEQPYVTYLRVSTARQGESGLGLEARQAAVHGFVKQHGGIVQTFVEVESGKRSDRPELAKAMAAARNAKATLLSAVAEDEARRIS